VVLAVQVHDPGVIGAFAGGMLSFLSPCVLPLVPGYLSLVSGLSVAELQEGDRGNVRRVVLSTLLFVAGFTAVFVALGAAASGLGQTLREHQRVLEQVAGAVVMAMGVFLAGFVSPRFLMVERRLHVSPSEVGAWAPPLMGAAFAFGWTPCIGPVLATILTIAAAQDTVAHGAVLLGVYSLGIGVPFLLAALFIRPFLRGMRRFGFALRHVERVMGALLVVTGLLIAIGSFTAIGYWLLQVFPALGRIG
jgi:cytochrome c-type biogenesis protein